MKIKFYPTEEEARQNPIDGCKLFVVRCVSKVGFAWADSTYHANVLVSFCRHIGGVARIVDPDPRGRRFSILSMPKDEALVELERLRKIIEERG